jgi:signal transduction histidine kinase
LFANLAARRIIGLGEVPKDPGEILAAFLARFTTISLDDYYGKARPDAVFIVPEITTNERIYKLSFDCLFDSLQNATGMLIWIEDITEEKELEKKKSDFISLVTHQLRTPLSGLKWTLRMLINGDLGPLSNEQKVFLMKSYEGNERMISLVDNILGINKIEFDQYRYNYVTTKILDLLDNVLYEISPTAGRKRITIQIINRDENIPSVMVDPEKMRAVLQNILENAVKYSLEGGVVTIKADYAQGFVRVSVKDTGIGIPKAQQQNIFSQFFRAQNATDSVKQGSGLGLYIVKNIIEKHHGKIWFESIEGKGTTFFFTVPVEQVSEPATTVGW